MQAERLNGQVIYSRAPKKIGARGFEPPTPRSRTVCATRLRYAPNKSDFYMFSTISHTPQGQMPAQKLQPMHLFSSTTYSYAPPSCSTLLIAPQ